MRIGALHHLAVHFQDQPQHAVRGGMLRAEIDHRVESNSTTLVAAGGASVTGRSLILPQPFGASAGGGFGGRRSACTFSSPGSVVTPSHGDMKSKVRQSCVSRTGS